MLNSKLGNFSFICAASFVVSACANDAVSRGEPVEISLEEQATRVFSSDAGDAADALANGSTLTARSVSIAGQSLGYSSGNTGLVEGATVSLRRVAGTNNIVLTLNGEEFTFTDAEFTTHDSGYEIQDPDSGLYVSLYNFTGDREDFFVSGNGYSEVLVIQSSNIPGIDPSDLKAYAVIGTETQDDVLPTLTTATYSGNSRTDVVPNTGFESQTLDRTRVRSDVSLSANFSAGEVSGMMSNFNIQGPEDANRISIEGSMAMNTAELDVNGFESSLTPDSTLQSSLETATEASLTSGTYSGAFYGPEAEEAAGVISLEGTDTESGFNGIGFFHTEKDVN